MTQKNRQYASDKLITNPVIVMRLFCLECCGQSRSEVRKCPNTNCRLYPYRMGTNPYRKHRVLSLEEKSELVSRLRKNDNGNSSK